MWKKPKKLNFGLFRVLGYQKPKKTLKPETYLCPGWSSLCKLIVCIKMIAKVSENMIVPPTNKVLKVMKRIRSITAAASFQSRFLSSSSSAISRSSASFRNCARRRLRISTRSLSVVPSVASSYGWCELFWKSTASMLFFLLPTGDGVAGFSGFMRRHDASLIQINHFICRQVTDDIKSRKWSDYIRLKTANDSCTAFKDNIFISVLWLLQTVLFVSWSRTQVLQKRMNRSTCLLRQTRVGQRNYVIDGSALAPPDEYDGSICARTAIVCWTEARWSIKSGFLTCTPCPPKRPTFIFWITVSKINRF